MASPTTSGTGSSNPFTGNPPAPSAGMEKILQPDIPPQRMRNDPALDTSNIPTGGRVLHADVNPSTERARVGYTGPGTAQRLPFTILGGGG